MSKNIDKFKQDLDYLIKLGGQLQFSMMVSCHGLDEVTEVFSKGNEKDEDKIRNNLEELPNFYSEYDSWYSESLLLVKQLIPDRLDNFQSFYEKPKNRKKVSYDNYTIQDFLDGLVVKRVGQIIVDTSAAKKKFDQQLSILKSAKRRFESTLFDIKQILQADIFDNELDAAKELNKNKFYRAAGVLVGVVIEKHLAQVCEDHNVTVRKKNPGISDLNQLLRDADVIDIPQWRFNQHIADLRNICGHNKDVEPTQGQIEDMLSGVSKVIKTIT